MNDRPIPPASRLIRLLNEAWVDVHWCAEGRYDAAVAMLERRDPVLDQWARVEVSERAEARGRSYDDAGRRPKGSHSDPTAAACLGPERDLIDGDLTELRGTHRRLLVDIGWMQAAVTQALYDASTVDYAPATLADAADDLAWCTAIPHTVADAAVHLGRGDRTEDARELRHAVDHITGEAKVLRGLVSAVNAHVAAVRTERPAQPKCPPCIVCAVTVDVRSGRCGTCREFRRNHGVDRTEAIIRWHQHQPHTTPPRLLIEARAAAKAPKPKRRGKAS